MNNLLEEAYKNYCNVYPDVEKTFQYEGSTIDVRKMTQEEFINRIKTDDEFAKKWGVEINERELNSEERYTIHKKYITEDKLDLLFEFATPENLNKLGVPTKLTTITYNGKTEEIHE